jgi:uncharacterized membrane protein
MANLEKSVEVKVPVRTAYNQWTQFEDFPQFMSGIEYVRQLDDKTLVWKALLLGNEEEWKAEITEQHPDERIAWRSLTGAKNAGVITFHYIDENTSRVMLQLEYDPDGFVEHVGSAIGVVDRYVENALQRYKAFLESRQTATGAWRGNIDQEKIQR